MSAEFALSVEYYRLLRGIECPSSSSRPTSSNDDSISTEIDDSMLPDDSEAVSGQGYALTSSGPAPYTGDILESPEVVWSDDVWTPEREEEAKQKIAQQGANVSDFWRNKYETKAGYYWHAFYQRNTDNFYKDRHYLHVVWPELVSKWRNAATVGYNSGLTNTTSSSSSASFVDYDSQPLHLLEVGCGVGNAVVPLVELNPLIHINAFDFAKSAIEILRRHPVVLGSGRLHPHTCDLVNEPLPVSAASQDLVLCMFVLSAVGPDHQLSALSKLAAVLRTGGKLLFRDYGQYDEAQLRFKKGSKLGDNFYVRQDGTLSYFFTLPHLCGLCERVGLRLEDSEVIQRQYANRQQRAARYRVWIQAKFVKV